MKKSGIIFSVIIIIGLGLGGWYFAANYPPNNNVENETQYFVDSMNRNVSVPVHPERIVSMAPSITEILFALNVEDRLVGVTDYCNYPDEAKNITKIGGFSTPDLEKLTSLNPDLIIAAAWNPSAIETLEEANFTIVVILADTISDIINNINKIGKLVDAEEQAKVVTDGLWAHYWAITNKTSEISDADRLNVYFEIWSSPMAVGNASFINDLISAAGGINIFGDINETYPIVSNEEIIARNPDVIFVTEHSYIYYNMSICERDGYDAVNACKNGRIYAVNDDIYLRPGPRIIDALENMTAYLYPNLMVASA